MYNYCEVFHTRAHLCCRQPDCAFLQAVFERLVDIICDKMSESLDSDPSLLSAGKGTRLESAQPANVNCNC